MAFQFPASPVVGQTYTPSAGLTFKWNGTAWYLVNSTLLTPTEADTRYVQIANARSMESRIINGNFAVNQRYASNGVTVASTSLLYTLDRWAGVANGSGTFQVQRVADGSASAMTVQVITPDASLAAADQYEVGQLIEGTNMADMQWGRPAASPMTLAFRIFSNTAATLPVSFNSGNWAMSYVKTMTLPANVWTQITMTIPGPTSGTWASDNTLGLHIFIVLGAGSSVQAPVVDTWLSGAYITAAGCTNLMATAGAAFTIANARLYLGTIDYGPCQRLYADELRLCQRYYEKSYNIDRVPGAIHDDGSYFGRYGIAATSALVLVPFLVQKRAQPAMTLYSPKTGASGMWHDLSAATDRSAALPIIGETRASVDMSSGGAGAGNVIMGHWTASAEL